MRYYSLSMKLRARSKKPHEKVQKVLCGNYEHLQSSM